MKTVLKWTGIILLLLIFGFSASVAVLKNRTFEAPYPQLNASTDPATIERGKAIVYGPAHCAHCHTPASEIDRIDKGEIVPLAGGHIFDIPPGKFYTQNITSDKETGIGNLPDSTIARSLRYGVGHDGRALFDFMPFHNLSDEDLVAVLSYLRSTAPVKKKVPETEISTLGLVLKAFVLKPVGPEGEILTSIKPDSSIAYGKYLAESVANCKGCHTNRDLKTGAYVGPFYGGGFVMPCENTPGKAVVTRNITVDPEHGMLAFMNEDAFIKRFRDGKRVHESTMPWGPFSRMSEMELKAIYRFLKTIPPVKNDPGPVLVDLK